MSCALPGPRPTMNLTVRCGQACGSVCACATADSARAPSVATTTPGIVAFNLNMRLSRMNDLARAIIDGRSPRAIEVRQVEHPDIACCFDRKRMVQYQGSGRE